LVNVESNTLFFQGGFRSESCGHLSPTSRNAVSANGT